jgi:photosystem II stability/assembly factor-like uncharacterized protein
VLSLARGPSTPDRVYAGTSGSGLFRSDDDGQHWAPTGLDHGRIAMVSVNPSNADDVWTYETSAFGSQPHVLRHSTDGALSWSVVSTPLPYVDSIGVAANVVWLSATGSQTNLYRSMNGGLTWIQTTFPNGAFVLAHPTDPSIAWVWDSGNVWRTGDAGASWVSVMPALGPGQSFVCLSGTPGRPLQLWLSVYGGNGFRSDDGGLSWQTISGGGSTELFVSATNPDVVFAFDRWTGLRRSLDTGAHFTPVAAPQPGMNPDTNLLFDARDSEHVLAFSEAFELYRSANGGLSWDRSVDGLTGVWVQSVAVSATGDLMLAGSDRGDVFRSVDQGHTWTGSRGSLPYWAVSALAVGATSNVVYAAVTYDSDGDVYESIDGAQSFTKLTPAWPGQGGGVVWLRVAPDGTLLQAAGPAGIGAWSTDDGLSWTTLVRSFADAVRVPQSAPVTVVGVDGAYRVAASTSYGATWQVIADPSNVLGTFGALSAGASRVAPLTYYAGTKTAFGKYDGSMWSVAQVGMALDPDSFNGFDRLAVGACGGQDCVATFTANQVHFSADGAQTWRSYSIDGLGTVTDVAVADANGKLTLIGLKGGRSLLVTRTGGL